MKEYLSPTYCIDNDHSKIKALAEKITKSSQTDSQKVASLYYAVRDGWRYNPYNISFDKSAYKASTIVQGEEGHCIDKAILLIALCRACGFPARLGLSSVRNHIATGKFEKMLGTNILVPHGYAEVYLQDKWVKLTPAFNKSLCEKIGVNPLEFDGHSDALFQEYNQKGASFMEYLEDFGTFENVPIGYMRELMEKHYPALFDGSMDVSFILRT